MMKRLAFFLVVLFCAGTLFAQDLPVAEPAGQEPPAAEVVSHAEVAEAPKPDTAPENVPDGEEAPVAEAVNQAEVEQPEPVAAPEPEPAVTPAPKPEPVAEPAPVTMPEPKPAPAPVPISAAPAPQGKQTVAIYMAGKEPQGAKGVHNILGGELARTISTSEKYTGVDRTEAIQQQLSREHTFQRSGAVDDDQIKSLGQQLGVQYLCISDINPVRGRQSYYLDVRLIDVVTAEIIRTTTANSNLRNADEMKRIARSIAYDLIETEKAAEQRKRRKKAFFYTAISADVLGTGMLAYGLIENSNMKMYVDGANFSDAERAQTKRNAAYIIGSVLLVSGVSIHILF